MNHDKQKNAADPQLVAYILENRRGGADDHAIREALASTGWPKTAVQEAFAHITAHAEHSPIAHDPQASHGASAAKSAARTYKLFTAIADGFRTIKTNLKGFVLIALINIAISCVIFAAIVILAVVGFMAVGAPMIAGTPSAVGAIGLIIFMILASLAYLATYAFMMASFSIAANDGAEGRETDIAAAVHRSLKAVPRVMLSQLLVGVIIVIPVLLLIPVLVLMTLSGGGGEQATTGPNGITAFLIGLTLLLPFLIWAVLASLIFILLPLIVIFEPHVTLRNGLTRSWHLMRARGLWFMIKAMLLTLVLQIPLIPLMANSNTETQTDATAFDIVSFITSALFTILYIPLTALCIATLVVFYRNRVAVRDK